MSEVIPFPLKTRRLIPPALPAGAGLAGVLERFADSLLPAETYREVYYQEGLSILIVMTDFGSPTIVTSDEVTQLFSIELHLGSIKPELLHHAIRLVNEINCRADRGHFEYIDGGIRYRNSCSAITRPALLAAKIADQINLDLVAELIVNGKASVDGIAERFAPMLRLD